MNATPGLAEALERLRARLGRPVRITSGSRCARHNRAVGGVKDSRHLEGRAADVACPEAEQPRLVALARACGFDQAIPYGGRGFVHLGVPRA
jgi:uncharacterized protein YcbK (DUF882 family)